MAIDPTHALTAAHCLETPENPALTDPVLEVHAVARMIATDDEDLALLELDSRTPPLVPPFAQVASGLDPRIGDLVFVAGYGCFEELDVRPGVFLRRTPLEDEYLLNATVCLGDSGGPTFNVQGQLLSVHSRTSVSKTPLAFEQTIEPALTRLRERASVTP